MDYVIEHDQDYVLHLLLKPDVHVMLEVFKQTAAFMQNYVVNIDVISVE